MLDLPPFGDFPFMTRIALTASGAVAGAFVLKRLTGYSCGIQTNNLRNALCASAVIFASGAAVNEVTRGKK